MSGTCRPDYDLWHRTRSVLPARSGRSCPILGDVTSDAIISDSGGCSVHHSHVAELVGDPAPGCLVASADLNCDGLTNVTDVILSINWPSELH